MTRLALILLALGIFMWVWFRPNCHTVLYYSTSGEGAVNHQSPETSRTGKISLLDTRSKDEPLVQLLGNLTFKNYGIVKSRDEFVWIPKPCRYLEAQNVSRPYMGWAVEETFNYLYHSVSGDLLHPPSGMRSSVPLGGECSRWGGGRNSARIIVVA